MHLYPRSPRTYRLVHIRIIFTFCHFSCLDPSYRKAGTGQWRPRHRRHSLFACSHVTPARQPQHHPQRASHLTTPIRHPHNPPATCAQLLHPTAASNRSPLPAILEPPASTQDTNHVAVIAAGGRCEPHATIAMTPGGGSIRDTSRMATAAVSSNIKLEAIMTTTMTTAAAVAAVAWWWQWQQQCHILVFLYFVAKQ